MTGVNEDTYYNSVVSLWSTRMLIFSADMKNLEMCSGDVGNAYFDEYTHDNIFFIIGNDVEFIGHNGHTMLISTALYEMKTSGARWHDNFSEFFHQFGLSTSN